ncbi:MAG: formylglycine-generating enzyme family protein [Planctomycetes bacterium]|nr:formylglycine-generating enzyme family protein [Planctomycetota bacterium]
MIINFNFYYWCSMRTLAFLCLVSCLVSPCMGLAQPPKEEIIDLGAGVKIEMVLIHAGKFTMGSPASEPGRSTNEIQHEVIITKPFLLGKYEITQSQWEAIMGNNPSSGEKGPMLPVTDVSWNDCQKFLAKLNEKTKGAFRLPSEAQWEYACRAGTTTSFSFGNELKATDANHAASNINKPVKVGSYKPNAFGLYDMHGNVNEWCNDWFKAYPSSMATDPTGPANGEYRIVRGGTCVLNSFNSRCANRNLDLASVGSSVRGFRIAK